ncbi:MAG: UDP-glucose 4-epimerase GalE [Phycisphaeraceae bacterium]|nr:UDP-glucose 4-epimerase GalE [Phycisphaeraceae bacterium]
MLVTGGAGYIGSHCVKRLVNDAYNVTVLDNCDVGHEVAVERASGGEAKLVQADLRDTETVTQTLRDNEIEGVIHFAALAQVGESVQYPLRYYDNNAAGSVSLLRAMDRAGVNRIVFSSTCATYGEPASMPIVETMPQQPINPYGWSKLMTERALIDYGSSNGGFAFAVLRYFNVAGSDPDAVIGEDHTPESHIIPAVLNCALGKVEKMSVFGTDYDTPDGTCIRDYIHVNDLVDAHVHVINALEAGDQRFYNLGTGTGTTVLQIIEAGRDVTGHAIPAEMGPRRPGDPPMLYADPSKIKNELGWQAKCTDIKQMVADAWGWFKNNPDGYGDK